MQANDVMTAPVITATGNTKIPELARTLFENHISAVPILDAAGKLVGIVSEGDLIRQIGSE